VAEAPAITVAIPTHERREPLRRCLESLASQTVAPGSYEVVVSLDACGDGTEGMLGELRVPYELRRVEPARRGRAAACNAAIAAARGEVLIVLDDDMTAAEELLARHLVHHPPGSRRCVLGAVPVALREGGTHAARHVKERFDRHLSRLGDRDHLELPRSFYSGNASLRTEVIRAVGGFDESFGFYGNEDVELALRLREAGVRLEFDPAALAHQEYGKDLVGLQRDTEEKGRTTVLLARAHPEVFADLRLAAPDESSRPWLAARSLLLWATRRVPATARLCFACAALLERIGLWRQPLFYRATLDYAFWAGVDASLAESEEDGELASLAVQLRRGPIDLLLHG
jgi:GT2 family glycosyltransferase